MVELVFKHCEICGIETYQIHNEIVSDSWNKQVPAMKSEWFTCLDCQDKQIAELQEKLSVENKMFRNMKEKYLIAEDKLHRRNLQIKDLKAKLREYDNAIEQMGETSATEFYNIVDAE
jgi:hypothetical protein